MLENLDTERLMAGPLGGWLAEQATVREEAARLSNGRFVKAGVVLVPLLLYAWFSQGAGFFSVIVTMATAGAAVWCYAPRAAAIQAVKIGMNEAIAGAIGITFAQSGDCSPVRERCGDHAMLPGYNRNSSEDFWTGTVAGQPFHVFEATLQKQTRDSKGRTRTRTVFRGPMLTIGFARRFHGTTLVARDGSHRGFLGLGGRKDVLEVAGKRLARVEMVNPEFEDTFDVYSDDQVEGRYLVHPNYIERLLDVERAFDGADLRALFTEDQLTVVLAAKDMFESGGMDASGDRARLDRTVTQFRALAELAQSLNERPR